MLRHALGAAVIVCGVAGCTTDQPGAPLFRDGPFDIVGIPADSVLLNGSTLQLRAVAPARSLGGATDVAVAWATSDRDVATISAEGRVRGVGVGEVDVLATSDGATVTRALSVRFGIRIPERNGPPITTTLLDGAIRMTVSAGAVEDGSVLYVRPAVRVTPSPLLVAGTAFEFGPVATQLKAPVTLWLAYPNSVAPQDRSRLRIHVARDDAWSEVPGGSVNLDDERARAPITRLGTYAVLRGAPPTGLVITEGDNQRMGAGSPVPIKPKVLVRDADARPLPDIAVRFTVTAGGGRIDGDETGVSLADGTATLPGAWRLGESSGLNTLRAVVTGYDVAAVEFSATAIVPPPEMRLSEAEVNFDLMLGAGSPSPRFVQVTNVGGQTLSGLSLGPIVYGTGSGWLGATLSQSVAPATIALAPSTQELPTGSHVARVPVRTSIPGVAAETITVRVSVVQGIVTQIVLTQQLGGAVSGRVATTQPRIELRTSSGERVPNANAPVTAALVGGDGTLRGTTTINAREGVATFTDLRVDGEGDHRLQFISEGRDADGVSFAVMQELAQLHIAVQPDGAEEDRRFDTQPVLRLLDDAGLLMRSSAKQVTASIESGGGELKGSRTVTANDGVVTYTNLRIDDRIGVHQLRFSTTNPGRSAVSAEFYVWPR